MKHQGQDHFKWMNSMGETVARKSALKVVEKLIEGPNQKVLTWSRLSAILVNSLKRIN